MPGGGRRGGDAGGSARAGVSYTKAEPAFITKMKQQIGYKDSGPSLEDKRAPSFDDANRGDDDGDSDRDDEQPTIVVLRKGDLTEEEAKQAKGELKGNEDDSPADGRIRFQKPTKRDADTDAAAGKNSTKRTKQDTKETRDDKEQPKAKQNKQLLSFGDDDEEEED